MRGTNRTRVPGGERGRVGSLRRPRARSRCARSAASHPATRSGRRPHQVPASATAPAGTRVRGVSRRGTARCVGQTGQVGEPGREAAEGRGERRSPCAARPPRRGRCPTGSATSSRSAPSYVVGTSTSAPGVVAPEGRQSPSTAAQRRRGRRPVEEHGASRPARPRPPGPRRPGRAAPGRAPPRRRPPGRAPRRDRRRGAARDQSSRPGPRIHPPVVRAWRPCAAHVGDMGEGLLVV